MYPYDNMQYPGVVPSYYPRYNTQPVQQNQVDNQAKATFYYVPNRSVVENWLLGKDQSVYFMESNAPVMYLKATDKDGRYYPLRTFDIVEREEVVQGPDETQSIDTSSFVKRDEITSLVAKAVEDYLNTPAKKEA